MPHTFDITALSRIGDEHVLAVEVACAPQTSHRGKRNITGIFQHWDGIDRDWNPGGLWRPVHVYDTGPVRVDRYRVLCRDADEARAHLLLSARLDSDRARARDDPHARSTAPSCSRTNDTWRRPQRGQLESRHRRPGAVVATRARRSADDRRRGRDRRRRRAQRPAQTPHRPAGGRLEQLVVLGQRRAPVPEGRQPAARHGRRWPRPRPSELRGDVELAVEAGTRRPAGPRPHRPTRDLRGGRRVGRAAAAGLPAPVGLRTFGPRPGGRAGPGGGRSARPSSVDHPVERPQRPGGGGDRDRAATRPAHGCSTSPPSSCRRGTSRCSTGGSNDPSSGPIRRGCVCPTRACSRICRCSTAPTATSTSGGTTATSATSNGSPNGCHAWCASCPSSGRRRCRPRATSSTPTTGPTSTGIISPSTTVSRSGCSTTGCRRATSPRSTSGGPRRRCTRPSCCATTSSCCGASSTDPPAGSACSPSTTRRRSCRGACSITGAYRSSAGGRSRTPAPR